MKSGPSLTGFGSGITGCGLRGPDSYSLLDEKIDDLIQFPRRRHQRQIHEFSGRRVVSYEVWHDDSPDGFVREQIQMYSKNLSLHVDGQPSSPSYGSSNGSSLI